jgi:hypothetical protein
MLEEDNIHKLIDHTSLHHLTVIFGSQAYLYNNLRNDICWHKELQYCELFWSECIVSKHNFPSLVTTPHFYGQAHEILFGGPFLCLILCHSPLGRRLIPKVFVCPISNDSWQRQWGNHFTFKMETVITSKFLHDDLFLSVKWSHTKMVTWVQHISVQRSECSKLLYVIINIWMLGK